MKTYNFPTKILFGEGALAAFIDIFVNQHRNPLVVTDKTLCDIGLVKQLTDVLETSGCRFSVFSDTHVNPIEEDVEKGTQSYNDNDCDSIIALGGGAPMDIAKAIKVLVAHPGPLSQYDEERGGDALITQSMPKLYAIPTTSGTGSEVGRAGVIIIKATNKKTIIFHPELMPNMAVLEPKLTIGLPPAMTAATGIDALTHCIEAYLSPNFHPMADGIALEGVRLILEALPNAYSKGDDIDARAQMQIAASMGATAFQKGLGMVHSLAHPLSAEYDTHHGLANALLLPFAIQFLENQPLKAAQLKKLDMLHDVFRKAHISGERLSDALSMFSAELGIQFGLHKHGIPNDALERLSELAFQDGCHQTNMIPVSQADLYSVYRAAI